MWLSLLRLLEEALYKVLHGVDHVSGCQHTVQLVHHVCCKHPSPRNTQRGRMHACMHALTDHRHCGGETKNRETKKNGGGGKACWLPQFIQEVPVSECSSQILPQKKNGTCM